MQEYVDVVSVLGTEYTVTENKSMDCDGETDFYDKTIQIRPVADMLDSEAKEQDKFYRRRETMRHELYHALFCESGLEEYAYDETLITWLANQYPKVKALFGKMECE